MKTQTGALELKRAWVSLTLGMALFGLIVSSSVRANAADSTAEKIEATASKVEDAVKDAGQTAKNSAEKFWERVDQKRLKNRTSDQIVAWVIIGLLVAGLIQRFSKLNWFATLLLGLAGAFIGGIAENLIHFDLGMGPVLISYEELLASLVGGILLILLARMLASRKTAKN